MKYNPKFKTPENKEEKLLCELARDLHEITKAYIRVNRDSCSDHEIFITIRDGVLAFAGQTIHALMNIMIYDKQKTEFAEESKDIFNKYINQAIKNDRKKS